MWLWNLIKKQRAVGILTRKVIILHITKMLNTVFSILTPDYKTMKSYKLIYK